MPRIFTPAEDIIKWEFQVEQQGFITRYGKSGGEYYKQTVLLSGIKTDNLHQVKRIGPVVYSLALRRSKIA